MSLQVSRLKLLKEPEKPVMKDTEAFFTFQEKRYYKMQEQKNASFKNSFYLSERPIKKFNAFLQSTFFSAI